MKGSNNDADDEDGSMDEKALAEERERERERARACNVLQLQATENKHGRNALCWAAHLGNQTLLKLLLDEGADIEAKANGGWTPLALAIDRGHNECVRFLVDCDADVHARVEVRALGSDSKAIASNNNNEGVETENRQQAPRVLRTRRTPLMLAAIRGNLNCVKMLLEAGAERYATDTDGKAGRTAGELATLVARGGLAEEIERADVEEGCREEQGENDSGGAKCTMDRNKKEQKGKKQLQRSKGKGKEHRQEERNKGADPAAVASLLNNATEVLWNAAATGHVKALRELWQRWESDSDDRCVCGH
jgi:hypothetical protein